MAVPRSRLSNARKNKRRAHHAKKPTQLVNCPKCEEKKLPHTLCQSCGYYGGKAVISTESGEES